MKRIPLTQGQFALVDDVDFESLNQWKWFAEWNIHTKHFKAKRGLPYIKGEKRKGGIYMHREIMSVPKNMQVDHINHDGLDNRRENLRVCTLAQNLMNKRKPSNNTSGFKGVSFHKEKKRWMARIQKNRKGIYLGYYSSPEAAASAYNEAAKKLFGEFACLNIGLC